MTAVPSTVLVLGRRQGSGVLVAPDLVLTSAHVLDGAYSAKVVPALRPAHQSQVVWSDERLDAALLRSPARLGPAPRLSTIATDRPVPGCEILGFPGSSAMTARSPTWTSSPEPCCPWQGSCAAY
ncbi:trypsin-like peptidase domain-containing protein [Streptomyces sp. NPDC004266]|uniref:trypsin-like peptidase domain-containing protein n=1 Tax=Streptomyces sp. NPDC004266 TaxID=3364693 RepID=UPI00369404D2